MKKNIQFPQAIVLFFIFTFLCHASWGADDNFPPVIEVLGGNPINAVCLLPYSDPGAVAYDDRDGQVPVTVIENNVNISVSGTYQVVYQAEDQSGNTVTAIRTVMVTCDCYPPAIVFNGENPAVVCLGSVYTDPGATAWHCIEGQLPATVIENTVNTGVIGIYAVSYLAEDQAGNASTTTRTVCVVDCSGETREMKSLLTILRILAGLDSNLDVCFCRDHNMDFRIGPEDAIFMLQKMSELR